MPLNRQLLTFPFALGLDTKSDPKQIPLGRLRALENGVFSSLKELRKRGGYEGLSRASVASIGGVVVNETITSSTALTSYREELLLTGRTSQRSSLPQVFSYSDGSEGWVSKGSFTPCDVRLASIHRSTRLLYAADGCVLDSGRLEVFAWENVDLDTAAQGVYYSVRDIESGQIVVDAGLVASGAYKPRVVPTRGGALIYYVAGDGLIYVRALVTTPLAALSAAVSLTGVTPLQPSTFAADMSRKAFDVIRVDDQILFAFNNDAGGITVQLFNASNAYNFAAILYLSPPFASRVVSTFYDSAGERVVIAYGNGAGSEAVGGWFSVSRYLTGTVSGPVTFTLPSGSAQISAIGGVAVPEQPDASRFRVFVSSTAAGPSTWFYTGSAAALTYVRQLRTLIVAAKPFAYGGQAFLPAFFVSFTTGATSGWGGTGIQNQVLLVPDTLERTEPVARALYGTAVAWPVTLLQDAGPPVVVSPVSTPGSWSADGQTFRIATMEYATAPGSTLDAKLASGVVGLSFGLEQAPLSDNRSEIGGSLVLGGGVCSAYDGTVIAEQNFLAWPDQVTVADGGAGNITAGTYQWIAVYEWLDNNGFVHRSAPSLPATLTITPGLRRVAVTISTLQFSRKTEQSPISVVLYRTLANGSTFYRVSEFFSPTINRTDVSAVSIIDNLVDASLASRALLYTTGGVVENIAPPPLAAMAVHRSRLWGVEATNRLRLWYTKPVSASSPAEFSDVFVFDVNPQGGDVTALGSLDDKLVVFKRSQIFVITGQGPDATGAQNDFSDAIFVTSDAGCIDARSLVTTPSGLIFQSTKGIYAIDRSLSVSYIGAEVEEFNGETIVSSQLLAKSNQVRFLLSSGVALVYDYLVGQWSVFTGHDGIDSVVWKDRFAFLRSNGQALLEDDSRFDDAGSSVAIRLTTGWVAFDGTGSGGAYTAASGNRASAPGQVFQRVRRLLILGEYRGPHKLRVDVAFDYDDTIAQSVVIDPPDLETYGEGSPYGENGSTYGGPWTPYQWRVDLSRQKCQAVRVTLTELRDRTTLGENLRLSALAFEIGVKGGLYRLPASQIFG